MLRVALIGAAVLAGVSLPSPVAALDPEPWEQVLQAHARRGGVDYAGLAADTQARARLDAFLTDVARMPDREPLASWLNAYNALVVREIVRRYPLDSVKDVPGFFDRIRHRVAGRQMTLDHLENQIIRVRFPDARVHAALNCGAQSCPALHSHAFRTRSLDRVLTRLAEAMVRSPRHVRVREARLMTNEIFHWFEADFVRDAGSVQAWIRRYDRSGRLRGVAPSGSVGRVPYDWRLNDR